ncbi:hypothetical protein CPARA_3gp441 (nucleomorph) [Cryptomonas paramecium]|uniref:Uncharacterized protein n=1 Tax=Cryptomonas paramaecium TaxID=2898 RepID=F2HIH5_9CRYP|nr:hypothetical protein CPARA_3gp441 [Cryptomonas paramecium]AEA39099.1 hypothetical protein CPARA_3gp441 [Cryptomonas paramecium]
MKRVFYFFLKKKIFKNSTKTNTGINYLVDDTYKILYTKNKNKISIGVIFLNNVKGTNKRFFFISTRKYPFKIFFSKKKFFKVFLHISLNIILYFKKLVILKQRFKNTMIS